MLIENQDDLYQIEDSRINEILSKQSEAQSNCPVTLAFTKPQIRTLLTNAGYTDISIETTHIFPYKIDKYINYEYELEDHWKILPKEMFAWLEKNLGWHHLVKAKLLSRTSFLKTHY